MKFVHKATQVAVKEGDEVTNNGHTVYVSGWIKPTSPAAAGRIIVVRDKGISAEQRMTQGMSFYPDVYGCEWIEREDRDDGDDNGVTVVCVPPVAILPVTTARTVEKPEQDQANHLARQIADAKLFDHTSVDEDGMLFIVQDGVWYIGQLKKSARQPDDE